MNRASSVETLKAVHEALSSDLEAATSYCRANASQYALRSFVRTTFALFEGLSYHFRQVTLASLRSTGVLSEAEVALLSEQRYTLDDKGVPKSVEQFLRFPDSVVFSIETYAKNHGASFKVDRSSRGWQAFKKATQIRNRVTHPKSPESLHVSDADAATVSEALKWWNATIIALFHVCSEGDAEWRRRLAECMPEANGG